MAGGMLSGNNRDKYPESPEKLARGLAPKRRSDTSGIANARVVDTAGDTMLYTKDPDDDTVEEGDQVRPTSPPERRVTGGRGKGRERILRRHPPQ
jgi:hypothetical protein